MPALSINAGTDAYGVFARHYAAGRTQLVTRQQVADLETPVSVYLRLAAGQPFRFLLESVEGGAVKGRYSIVGCDPDLVWRCHNGAVALNHQPSRDPDAFTPLATPPLEALRQAVAAARIDVMTGLPPAATALVGYLGYDMVRLVERLPQPPTDGLGLPDALFMRPRLIAIFDGVRDSLTLATPVRPSTELDARAAYGQAMAYLDEAEARLAEPAPEQRLALPPGFEPAPQPTRNTTSQAYEAMVARAKEYILAGDIFQVVLSQRFSLPFPLPALALYRALRRTNPSPFLFLLDFAGLAVVGSSPEILVRLRDGQVTIRPIAGTRPRGATPLDDKRLADELLADPKELAEHLMLLDLGRNDVGRVAKPGSVTVTERNVVEYYSHVMHIVSNVVGALADGEDAISALFAGFPAGTVTGAPKVRAMEIIDGLEAAKRGVYAGAVGYFGADGSMDSCIALRTAVLKDGVLYVQAGAGIVADSDPAAEQAECEAKARALIAAANLALELAKS
ncbi:MAG: anthranilate synthase component I [Pseudomonadota bacterium]